MLTGKRFLLHKDTLAVETIGDRRRSVSIPSGGIVKVVSDPSREEEQVDVLWAGRALTMFAVDVEGNSIEIA